MRRKTYVSHDADERYEEKRELVFQEYVKSLDVEVAMAIVPLSSTEVVCLLKDDELTARVAVCDARLKSELIAKLKLLTDSDSEGVRLSAVRELGGMFYPKRFKANQLGSSERPMHVIWDEVESSDEPD